MFYQSASMMNLGCISMDKYCQFAQGHFSKAGKSLPADVFQMVYERFEGITWYVQRVMNELFSLTSADFVRRWHLPSTSSVQSAIKGLLEKSFVTTSLGVYEVYDKFFAMWLLRQA